MAKSKKRRPSETSRAKKPARKVRTKEFNVSSAHALASRAVKLGYFSVLFGIFTAPAAYYYAWKAEQISENKAQYKSIQPRTKEARKMATFGLVVWILVALVQWGGGNG